MTKRSKYDWKVISGLYLDGKYTLTDLEALTGSVNGHISKKIRWMIGDGVFKQEENMRKQGETFIFPKNFRDLPVELKKAIKQYPNLELRLNLYNETVIEPRKIEKVLRLRKLGKNNAEIAKVIGLAGESSVRNYFNKAGVKSTEIEKFDQIIKYMNFVSKQEREKFKASSKNVFSTEIQIHTLNQ